jgi:hypothetical protein
VNVPTEGRWALVLSKIYPDGTQSRLTIYKYPSEQAARADLAKWQRNNPLYTEHDVMTEEQAGQLVEKEAQA